jgi:hypothetical protein
MYEGSVKHKQISALTKVKRDRELFRSMLVKVYLMFSRNLYHLLALYTWHLM